MILFVTQSTQIGSLFLAQVEPPGSDRAQKWSMRILRHNRSIRICFPSNSKELQRNKCTALERLPEKHYAH